MERLRDLGSGLEQTFGKHILRLWGIEVYSLTKDIIHHQVEWINEAISSVEIVSPPNELLDKGIILALEKASNEGVKVKIIFLGDEEEMNLKDFAHIRGLECYQLSSFQAPRIHFWVFDRTSVIEEEKHFPGEPKKCYFKKKTYFLGKSLSQKFRELILKATIIQ